MYIGRRTVGIVSRFCSVFLSRCLVCVEVERDFLDLTFENCGDQRRIMSTASIVSSRLSITALENYRRLIFRISNNEVMLILDGQDDLIQKIFHGLEALYFCSSYCLTVEAALAVLLTSSESITNLMGPVLSDQVNWLKELVSSALSFEYIQLLLQVTLCTYPHEKLHLYRSHIQTSESIENAIQLEDISSSVIEMAPEKIWLLLLWGEWLQMTSLIHSCRKEIVTFLLPHNTTENYLQSRYKLLFGNWPLSEALIEEIKSKLLQHFLDFGPTAKPVLSATSSSLAAQSPASKIPYPQGLSMKDLSSPDNDFQNQYIQRYHGQFQLHVPHLPPLTPPPPPVSSHTQEAPLHQKQLHTISIQERKQSSPDSITAIDQDAFFPSSSTAYNKPKHNYTSYTSYIQQNHLQQVSQHSNNQFYHHNNSFTEEDDTCTIDSWGTYADESSRLRALKRNGQKYCQRPSASQQPPNILEHANLQRLSHPPTPIAPDHYPTPPPHTAPPSQLVNNNINNNTVHISQNTTNHTSRNIHKPNRSISPHSPLSSIVKSTAMASTTSITVRASDDKLALAREVALLRLRHVKIQQELQKSKLQAAQALKMTSLQSLSLKSAVIRVASTSPGRSRYSPTKSLSPQSSHHREDKPTMNLCEQSRLQEAERQESLLAKARQRCLQRIQQKKADEKAKTAYETRQQQYKQSLQRQQREKNIVSAIHKQQQTSTSLSTFEKPASSSVISRAVSPATSMKRVSFAASTANKAKKDTTATFEEDMMPSHPENHHRYSLAALHAVAAGFSPNRVSTTITSATTSSTFLGHSGQKLSWPSPAQLQQIKLQRQQQHRSTQSNSSSPAVISSSSDNNNSNLTLKPPKRDVSPTSIIKSSILKPSSSSIMNSNDKIRHSSQQSTSSDLTRLHKISRSISDFDQEDDARIVKETDKVLFNDDSHLHRQMDEYMIEVSLGEIYDLLDERCLGPVHQIYLLLKRFSQRLLEINDTIRSPSVTCQSQSHAGFLAADFQGMCIHFPVGSLPCAKKKNFTSNNNIDSNDVEEWKNDEKLRLEVFARQVSVADICIARTEVNLSSLLLVQSMQQERMKVHWQKLILYDPDRSDRVAGMIEMAADAISLFA